jgi:hypothetical protein
MALCSSSYPPSDWGGSDPWFCFVYHETDKVFTPWGHNSQLELVSPAPCACQCGCD